MNLRKFLSELVSTAAAAVMTMWNAVKQLVAACGLRTASFARSRQSTSMSDKETISDELRPTIHGDVIKPQVDPTAAGYVIHYNQEDALNHITHKVKQFTPSEKLALLPDDKKELRAAVEWYVRENYQHVSAT